MRIARRWHNESSKRSVFDSILDKVMGDLFSGNDRPKRRPRSAARPAAKPRRQNFMLEAIEPRLLLSADISYTPDASNLLATHFTLKAVSGTDVKLYDDAATPNEVGSATLSDGSLTIERGLGKDVFADTIHIDLDSFSNLDAVNAGIFGHDNLLSIQFTGGDQTFPIQRDLITLDGSSANVDFGLTVKSDSSISSSAHASFGDDFSLEVTEQSTGFLNSDKAVFAQTNALITIDSADITANNIKLSATSDLTGLDTDGFSISAVDAKVIVALATTNVSILGGSHLTAGGDLTISAITNVGTIANDAADSGGEDNPTGDVVVALTTVTASTTLSVQGSQTLLSATGNVKLTASTGIDVTTTADGHPGSSKGASVAVSIVTGDGTHASVSGGAEIDGAQIEVNALSDLSVVTSATSTVGGAEDDGSSTPDTRSKQALADPKNDGSGSGRATTGEKGKNGESS